MHEWTLQDAKNKPGQLIDAALAGEPQHVLVQGQRAVVILSAAEYDRLRQLEESHPPSFSGLLLELPQDDQEFDRPNITPRALDL
ncbi:MAG: type II toxin-antitoxin system Phd/YefM family antitoxin [Chloroflexi bacterium]|nr:type II toxin-antitoxin system Phd/YefM family antitoxin [Chloroflexota bacterium]